MPTRPIALTLILLVILVSSPACDSSSDTAPPLSTYTPVPTYTPLPIYTPVVIKVPTTAAMRKSVEYWGKSLLSKAK